MKQQLSVEQINKLEEDARTMRSEAVFETFAAYFGRAKKTFTSLFVEGRKTCNRVGNKSLAVR